MKIVFISNTCEHVVRPFCDGLFEILGNDFVFIETKELDSARKGIGSTENRDYIMKLGDDKEKAIQLCTDADVCILGGADFLYLRDRVRKNKLTFIYAERLFKKGFFHYFNPKTFFQTQARYIRPSKKSNVYLLTASAFATYDFNRVGAFKDKAYKFGYQIYVNPYDIQTVIKNKPQEHIEILWVGRLVKLKHCEHAIQLMRRLYAEGERVTLTIIGAGPEEENLKQMIGEYGLDECVKFKGVCSINETRQEMLRANIFLFTSDQNEGWGVTLNEAMNSGCACVASNLAGSTMYLLENGFDGLIYKSGDVDDLYKKTKILIKDKETREVFGERAYKKMMDEWNPFISSHRFMSLIQKLQDKGSCNLYKSGPCSKAEVIKPIK